MNPSDRFQIDNTDVSASPFNGGLPLVIQPAVSGLALEKWGTENKELIAKLLYRFGALLFRNFGLNTPNDFQTVVKKIGGEPLNYMERSSPRSEVVQGVFTSTDYPANQSIPPHNENSYAMTVPLKLFFFCETPPAKQGETPIVDTRRVLHRLSKATLERFQQKKWMLVRNLHGGAGAGYSWQSAFQTDNPKAVEDYCRSHHILFEWLPKNHLRIRQIRAAVEAHPYNGEQSWFNHAAFFHISSFEPKMRDALLAAYGNDGLPNNTYYGDGAQIEPAVMDDVRAAYQAEQVAFPWQKGDLLMIDNILVAHARAPYQPPRKILVALTEPYDRPAISAG